MNDINNNNNGITHKVLIIGGGAAGLMAAAHSDADSTVILEKNSMTGKKLLITGKGRCNVTNDCDVKTLVANVPVNGRFLYSAFSKFSSRDLMDFFQSVGVDLKTERGNRVFPASDRAADIAFALKKQALSRGVEIVKGRAVNLIIENNAVIGASLSDGSKIYANSVIIATGGASYPTTGSSGDGYILAKQAGHTVTAISPSLVPLETVEAWTGKLTGLALKNVAVNVYDNESQSVIYKDFGEMLFTHFGVSGPIILSASSHLRSMSEGKHRYTLYIDLKPALDKKNLDARILRDFNENPNRDFANALGKLLPRAMAAVVVELSGIDKDIKIHSITKEMRQSLVTLLKAVPLTVKAYRPINEAIITSGGIDVGEINPSTMESKLVKGLYFAGEVIDADAYTGGFNLQIAFSTGYVAGTNA